MFPKGMNRLVAGIFCASLLCSAAAFAQGAAQTAAWDQQMAAGRKAYAQSHYDEAAQAFSAALQQADQEAQQADASSGAESRVMDSLKELGQTYVAQKKYDDAEPLYLRVLAIQEKSLGPDNLELAKTLASLASLFYRVQNHPEKAEPYLKRELAIQEKNLGPDDPEVASTLNSLAGRLREQGKFTEAEPLFMRSLAIREKVLGTDNPDYVKSLLGIASFYSEQAKYSESEQYYKQSLEILQKIHAYGTSYPNVAGVMNTYAQLLRKTNRESEAAEMEARAKAIAADPTQH